MIFYFAVDEVVPCIYRRTFPMEAESLEEAQQLATTIFEVKGEDLMDDLTTEVYLNTENKPIGRRELIYRSENGGSAIKDNQPPKVIKPEIEVKEYLTGPQGMKFELYPIRGTHTMEELQELKKQIRRDRDVAGMKIFWKDNAVGHD